MISDQGEDFRMRAAAIFFMFQLCLLTSLAWGVGKDPSYSLEELYTTKNISFSIKEIKKPTIIFFWASWCKYCKQVLPQITEDILKKYEIVSISCDENKKDAIKANEREYGGMKPVYWMDKKNNPGKFIEFYPTLYIVLPGGKIDTVYEGSQSDKMGYFFNRLKYLRNENF